MVDTWMEFDAADIARGMKINEDEVVKMMKDGRYAAPWMEKAIRREFNLDEPEGDEDAMSNEGAVEFKGITKYGVKIVPSWMVGSGRSVDWERLDEWFDQMSGGFILHDNTKFPSVPCWWINSEKIKQWVEDGKFNTNGGMSYNTIVSLLA